MRKFLIALGLLLAWPAAAQINPLNFPSGYANIGEPNNVSAALAYWGLDAYSSAVAQLQTQPLVNLRRSSDSHTCDILVSSKGGMGSTNNCSNAPDLGQPASVFCGGTSCFIVTLYDQAGSGRNLTQATAANQPALVFNCYNNLPCIQTNGATPTYVSGTLPGTGQAYSVGWVAARTGSSGTSNDVFGNNAQAQTGFNNAPSQAYLYAGTAVVTAAISENVMHVVTAVFNGASSALNVDGTATSPLSTGVASINGGAGLTAVGASRGATPTNPCTCNILAVAVWPYAISPKNQQIACHLQSLAFGLPIADLSKC